MHVLHTENQTWGLFHEQTFQDFIHVFVFFASIFRLLEEKENKQGPQVWYK